MARRTDTLRHIPKRRAAVELNSSPLCRHPRHRSETPALIWMDERR